jgi:hypothetical protein
VVKDVLANGAVSPSALSRANEALKTLEKKASVAKGNADTYAAISRLSGGKEGDGSSELNEEVNSLQSLATKAEELVVSLRTQINDVTDAEKANALVEVMAKLY